MCRSAQSGVELMLVDRRYICAPLRTAMASILERFGNSLVPATSLTEAAKSPFTATKSWFLHGGAGGGPTVIPTMILELATSQMGPFCIHVAATLREE